MLSKAFFENIRIAWRSIRGQLLRTVLTVLIISIGIMALVGIFASTDNLKAFITSEFTAMGSNTFSIQTKRSGRNSRGKAQKVYEPISYYEAQSFKDRFDDADIISVSSVVSDISTLKFNSQKTNPNVRLIAGDEHYLSAAGYSLGKGRNFSRSDNLLGTRVVILGADVVNKLFVNKEEPIDKIVSIGSAKYKVIGVLKSKGNSLGIAGDNLAYIPLGTFKLNYGTSKSRYAINVIKSDPELLDQAIESATGVFRIIRGDRIGEEESFRIRKSDSFANDLLSMISVVKQATVFIAIITLLGAGIGLMNIMLVSVSERTREIGLRKSIGATNKTILNQFLWESIMIGQMGGLLGTLLGILLSVIVGFLLGSFVFPWTWIIVAVIVCVVISVLSGIYPASRAAKLDPIESLRYE